MKYFIFKFTAIVLPVIILFSCFELYLRLNSEEIDPSDNLYIVNSDPLDEDPVLGSRLKADSEFRMARTIKGKLIVNSVFKTNNDGYPSHRKYEKKRNPGIYRICTMGDSFTAGLFLNKTFSEELELVFRRKGLANIEVYNLGVTGAGLLNWYRQMQYEIPKYSCDMIVLNIYYSDLDRPYTLWKKKGQSIYIAGLNEIPSTFSDMDGVAMKRRVAIKPDFKVIQMSDGTFKMQDDRIFAGFFQYPYLMYRFQQLGIKIGTFLNNEKKLPLKGHSVSKAYDGIDKCANGLLKNAYYCEVLFDFAKIVRNAPYRFILSEIPSRECVVDNSQPFCNKFHTRIKLVSEMFDAPLYSSHYDFNRIAPDLEDYWYQDDGHFNQKGSDYYAELLATYLVDYIK